MRIKILCLVMILFGTTSFADLDTPVSVNVKNAPMKNVLEVVASKAGLRLIMDPDLSLNVTIAQSEVSARKVLELLVAEYPVEYSISGTKLFVDRVKTNAAAQSGESNEIILHHATATELVSKLSPVVGTDGKLLSDEHSNKLIFIGSKKSFEKLKSMVAYFDTPQKQIMIEAVIVETSHNFLQQLGISLGKSGGAISESVSNPGPSTPNITFNAILGQINSDALNLKLTAAQTKGDAKIVSRPKVVTLNNRPAKVESGVTFNIKTLSNVSAGTAPSSTTSGNQGVVTGSVTSLDAVLSLNILPMLIGDDQIKLTVDINDSSPDLSNAVDGIPGILKNTASTAVIIRNKQTAVIAGLIKQTKSKSTSGVPILSDIPLLGWLFRSTSVSDTNNELVIFLTPTIDESGNIDISGEVDPALLVHSPLDIND